MSVKGGSVVDTDALSYGEIFAITFSVLTRWQQNLQWTTAHSAIRENNPILLLLSIFYEISRLLDPMFWRKLHFVKHFTDIQFWPKIPGISFYLCNKYVKEIREVHNQKVLQNSAVKLFWNFDNEMLWGRTSPKFEFSRYVIPVPANS